MRSRFLSFAAKLLVVAVLATAFVTATWLHFVRAPGPGWAWWAFPAALTGSFVPALLLGFRFSHPALRIVTIVSGIAIGFLSFGLIAAALCWAVDALARVAGFGIRMDIAAKIIFGLGLLVAFAGLVNAVLPRSVEVTVSLPGLPEAWRGRTVALVSDVHLGNVRGAAFVRHLVRRLQRRTPEAVFISGDMFDGTEIDAAAAAAPWARLRPPSGVYFVSGNHDDRGKRGVHLRALERAGIRPLNNEKVVVAGLQVVGVHDAETRNPATYGSILRRADIDRTSPAILLAHQPVNLDVAEAAGIALQLSGHTHAGQFWPWSLIARRVHGRYVYGLNRFGRMQVYTSSGAGTWGPPFRVGTHSEIVFLKLQA